MSAIASLASLNQPRSSATSSTSSGQALGRDDFLKLVMAQMRNQNPMEPLKDTEFVAQLAQFSQLDGIDKLNRSFSDFMALQSLTQGTNLIGKTVEYSKDLSGSTARGTVDSVKVDAGKIQLMIGGTAVALTQVRSIQAGARSSSTT